MDFRGWNSGPGGVLPHGAEPEVWPPGYLGTMLHSVLGRWNVCSKELFVRQYYQEVQGALSGPSWAQGVTGPPIPRL